VAAAVVVVAASVSAVFLCDCFFADDCSSFGVVSRAFFEVLLPNTRLLDRFPVGFFFLDCFLSVLLLLVLLALLVREDEAAADEVWPTSSSVV